MEEVTAAAYDEELKAQIRTGDSSTPGANTPSIEISEPIDFAATSEDLTARALTVYASSSPGSGWHEREYYTEDGKLG